MAARVNTIKQLIGCMFILLLMFQRSDSAFTEVPEGRIVPANVDVKFFCQNLNADAISWIVNGTVYINGSSIGVITEYGTEKNEIRHWLTIKAYIGYNRTTVSCLARYFSNLLLNQTSMTVMLLVQGTLDPVSDIRRDDAIITWEPPFILNLTDIEPDITYCVVVDRITCTSVIREIQECGILAPNYSSNSLHPSHRYRITVTAIVNGGNSSGTARSVEENFLSLSGPIPLDMGSSTVTLRLHVNNSGLNYVRPDSLIVRLVPIDGLNEQAIEFTAKDIVYEDTTMQLSISGVPLRRLWNVTVLHETRSPECTHHLSRPALLSTHGLQRVSVSSPDSGGILIVGVWINQSYISGVLAIVYSYFSNTFIYHKQDIGSSHSNHFHAHIHNVPKEHYNVSLFLLNPAGEPFERAINTPTPVSVLNSSDTSKSFGYDVVQQGTGVKVTCNFTRNSSATGCLVFAYLRFSLSSNSSFKLKIIESSKLRRYGDTASGLLDGVNLSNFQVGAVEDSSLPLDSGGERSVLAIALVCVIIFILGGVGMALAMWYCITKRKWCTCKKIYKGESSFMSPGSARFLLPLSWSPMSLDSRPQGLRNTRRGLIPLSLFQRTTHDQSPPPEIQLPQTSPSELQEQPPHSQKESHESQQQPPQSQEQLTQSQPIQSQDQPIQPQLTQSQDQPIQPQPIQSQNQPPQLQDQSHESQDQPPQPPTLEPSLKNVPPFRPEGAGKCDEPHNEHYNENSGDTDSNSGQSAGDAVASYLAHDTAEATNRQESVRRPETETKEALEGSTHMFIGVGFASPGHNSHASKRVRSLEQDSGSDEILNSDVAGHEPTETVSGREPDTSSEQGLKDDPELFKGPDPSLDHVPGEFINPTSEGTRLRQPRGTWFCRSSHNDDNEEQVGSEHSPINTSIKYKIMPGDGACASDSTISGPLVKNKTDDTAHPQVTDDLTTPK